MDSGQVLGILSGKWTDKIYLAASETVRKSRIPFIYPFRTSQNYSWMSLRLQSVLNKSCPLTAKTILNRKGNVLVAKSTFKGFGQT